MLWFFLAGYCFGMIPFGLVIAKLHRIDIRQHGSKSIGATNITRVIGKKWGILTFVLDGLKGVVPVLIAMNINQDYVYVAGLGAVVGHMYSVLLKFKGGKGVATTMLTAVAVDWKIALIIFVVWLLVYKSTKYVSLASMISIWIGTLFAFFKIDGHFIFFICCALLITWGHRANIKRLHSGCEKGF